MNWSLRRRLSNWLFLTLAVGPWACAVGVLAHRMWIESETRRIQAAAGEIAVQLAGPLSVASVDLGQQQLDLDKWQLRKGASTSRTMQLFEALARDTGITVQKIRAPGSERLGVRRFDIHATGTPEQICGWLGQMETHAQLLVIDTGRLLRHGESVSAQLRVAIFHQLGPE